jgi:hypothetical protein
MVFLILGEAKKPKTIIQYFTQFGHMTKLNESELVMQKNI